MALDTVTTLQLSANLTWNVSKTRTGLSPINNSQTLQHRVSFSKGAGADACNELIGYIQTVTANSNTSVDMSAALTNVCNDLSVTLARIKFFFVKLLSTSDTDDSGSVIGNACSGITLGNASNPWLFLGAAAHTITLNNGDFLLQTRRDATGLVVTSGSADTLKIVNNDAAVDAKVLLVFGGAAS